MQIWGPKVHLKKYTDFFTVASPLLGNTALELMQGGL